MAVALGEYVRELEHRLGVGTRRRHLMAEWQPRSRSPRPRK